LTNSAIALAWAVEPLALRVGLPPQVDVADDGPVVALPPVALLLPPHADNTTAAMVRMLSAAPNRLILNSIPLNDTDEMIAVRVAAARQTAVFLAAMRHSNKIAHQQMCPAIAGYRRIHGVSHSFRLHTVLTGGDFGRRCYEIDDIFH